jgi:hypothetical protein
MASKGYAFGPDPGKEEMIYIGTEEKLTCSFICGVLSTNKLLVNFYMG